MYLGSIYFNIVWHISAHLQQFAPKKTLCAACGALVKKTCGTADFPSNP